MKKAIVLLLALAVLGGVVFAEDPALAFSGYVTTGVKIVSDDTATNFQMYSDDWGDFGTTAYVDTSYTSDVAGFDVTIAGSTGYNNGINFDGGATVELDTAYGWISPVAGLKLIAGNTYGSTFDGLDDTSADRFAYKEGMFATYSISGFTAGAGINVPATASTEDLNYLFGAAYAMDGMFKARLSGNTVANDINAISATLSVLAVPNLTLTAGYNSTAMATTAVDFIDATVGYKLTDALSVQVVAYDYLAAEYFAVKPRVTYMVTPALKVYAQVGIYTEGADAVTNYATIKPRAYMAYTADVGKFVAQVEYNTEVKTTTALLYYVFSF